MTFTAPLTLATSITIAGYPVWDEGTEEHLGITNSNAVRTVVVNWTDRAGFCAAIGGGYNPATNTYLPPMSYPPYPWMVVQDIKTVDEIPGPNGPTNDANNLISFAWARLKITFARQRFDSSIAGYTIGDVELTFRQEIDIPRSVDSGGTPQPLWKFSDGTQIQPAIGIPVRIQAGILRIVRKNCSSNGSALSYALGGRVNAATLYGAPAETLYFNGTVGSKQITTAGNDNWTLSFDLDYRAIGWNTFFNPNATGATLASRYQRVTLISDGTTPPYASGDFSVFAGFI